jgi:drug/metabolite transporter (DMT)-like permease
MPPEHRPCGHLAARRRPAQGGLTDPAVTLPASPPAPPTGRPALLAAAGALCIASSAVLVRLAGVEPATAAVFRCAYALPVLGLLALRERRTAPQPWRSRAWSAGAGVFFAIDLVLWHHAIAAVGAGLATVLGNLQVLVVALVAWLLGERPDGRLLAAMPVVLGGVVLVSGVVGQGADGSDPVAGIVFGLGTAVAYAAFILMIRHGGGSSGRPAGPLFDATAVAVVVAVLLGPLSGGVDLVPSWPAHGWLVLLALSAQVVGWLLISTSLARLPAALTSMMLLLQPLGALLLAAAVLGEHPSLVQFAGCALVLAGVVLAASARRPADAATPTSS